MLYVLATVAGIILGALISGPLIRLIGLMLGLRSKDSYRFLTKK
jgi:hypothetical protein